jgi:uncharacterized protein
MSLRTKGILVYLAIAFLGVWPYLFIVRLALGWSLVNPLVQLPVAFMPAIGAYVVRRWVTREGFADAGLRLRLRGAWRQWLVAWFAPLGIVLLCLGVAAAAGWWSFDLSPVDGPGGLVVLLVIQVVLTPVYMGEEFGWTSYLWPRLVPGRPRLSLIATGFIWAVWHYPLAYLGYTQRAAAHRGRRPEPCADDDLHEPRARGGLRADVPLPGVPGHRPRKSGLRLSMNARALPRETVNW